MTKLDAEGSCAFVGESLRQVRAWAHLGCACGCVRAPASPVCLCTLANARVHGLANPPIVVPTPTGPAGRGRPGGGAGVCGRAIHAGHVHRGGRVVQELPQPQAPGVWQPKCACGSPQALGGAEPAAVAGTDILRMRALHATLRALHAALCPCVCPALPQVLHALLDKLADNVADYCRYQVGRRAPRTLLRATSACVAATSHCASCRLLPHPPWHRSAACPLSVPPMLPAQADAGAQVVQIFDSWASHLMPQDFDVFSAPYTKRVIDSFRRVMIGPHGARPHAAAPNLQHPSSPSTAPATHSGCVGPCGCFWRRAGALVLLLRLPSLACTHLLDPASPACTYNPFGPIPPPPCTHIPPRILLRAPRALSLPRACPGRLPRRSTHPHVPIILYISGGGGLLERMAACKPDCISLDQSVDIAEGIDRIGKGFAVQVRGARRATPFFFFFGCVAHVLVFAPAQGTCGQHWCTSSCRCKRCVLPARQGNMDPGILFGSSETIEARVMDVIKKARSKGVR